MRETQLNLIGHQGLPHVFLQELDLTGTVIADAEVADPAGAVKLIESFCDFLRLYETVRPVQQENIESVGPESFETAFDSGRDVLATVVDAAARGDAAF